MLKSAMYALLLVTTALRLGDLVYLVFIRSSTSLPVAVLAVTAATVLYGLALSAKRLFGQVRVTKLAAFFVVQTIAFGFNLTYMAMNVPLQISAPEIVAVGTFLDILLNVSLVFMCVRQRRGRFIAVAAQ